ncbi:MAG: amino acid adenylation domain-containing protein, partial [Acidobacteria bacterium]|nr:amino acid adenylation domain-containing protein [Acidobacteriota bacterium]
LAQQLKNHGFGPGHFAALCLERGLAFLTAIIAVFKAGGAYLPIDPEYPQERIQYMLQDSKAKIIVDSEFLTDAPQAPFLQHSAFITQHSNHLAYLIYTSGTTGEPKGVMIHHAGMMNHLYAKIDALGIGREDILAQTASACFDISVWQFLAALLTGGTTCIISKEIVLDAPRFLLALQRKQITILESVPSLITAFLESVTQKTPGTDYSLNSLRWMIPTGEPLTVSLARNWCRHYPHVKMVNAYGPTEASDDITHYTVMEMPSENQQTIPIGKPLPNLHIYILDRYLKLCPIGIRGEICVAGIGVGKGYWQDPIKTARAFVPNPFAAEINDPDYNTLYKTGDIGYYRPDGNIECLGRLDYQVKIRGYRIELGEIEQALLRHESIKEAAVIDLAHQDGSKYLCAYVTWQEGEGFNEQTGLDKLKSGLSRLLPGYMIPAYFVSLTSIPHTANGKVDRKALPRPQLQPHEPGIATQDPIQEIVANIWRDILEMGPVLPGTHADFFTVGGDSIKAIRVVNAVHKQLNARISIRDIFQFPTIAGLAGLIRENTHTPFHEITPLPPQEHYELSYAQKRLWVLQKRAPESQAFNMPEKVTLFEPVSEPLLRRVLELVTSRHESLRTYFTEIDGRIVQKIAPTVTVDIETLDLSHLEGELQTEQRNRLLTGESHIPFNLEIPPLLRIKLIKCRDNEFDLIYTMHHLVSDGWSLDVLRKEFINYYEALKQGRELSLPPARIRYVDYAHWHNRLLEDKDKLKQAREAWQKILLNPLPVLNLPYDFDPGKGKETGKTSSGYRFQVGMETLEKLRSTAANAHASLFMVLLSAFNLLLAQVGEQDDIVIGMPGAARPHEDVKNTIGLFVNTLVVLTKINKEETFNQLLAQVQTATLEILEVQDAKFDIVLYLQDFKNGIDIVCNYFTGLFLPETIEKVMTKYIRLLEKIALDPGKPVTEYKTETKKRLLRGNQ